MIGQGSGGQERLDHRRQDLVPFQGQPGDPECLHQRPGSNGFSRAGCISPRSNRPASSSDCCAAAAAAGSAAKSTSATTNSTAAWSKASTEVTPGTLTAWHARTPARLAARLVVQDVPA